jgi:hypothetical protein
MSRFTKSPNEQSLLQKIDDDAAPKHWTHESSGILAPVVMAYIRGGVLTEPQIKIMQAYLHQWVRSEAWAGDSKLEALRLRVVTIQTQEDIHGAVAAAVALGMDPL